MKKIILFLFVISLISCDSMLNVDPSDKYSANTFWSAQEQYNAALTGCYNNFYTSIDFFNGETDMMTPNSKSYYGKGTDDVAKGSALSTNPIFLSFWKSAYGGIGRANTLLDKIDAATFDAALRNKMKGEALFLRALNYTYLVNHFGGCPLIIHTPDNETQGKLPRNTITEVVAQIISDLDMAASLLPSTLAATEKGHATKGAALALKARMLLYSERWTEAAQAAKTLIDLGVYDLLPDYRGIYMLANENSKEVIFDIQYAAPNYKHSLDEEIYNKNRPAPLKDLVDAYLMNDGKSTKESILYNPAKPYDNRDPRLLQTINLIGYTYNGKITKATDVVVSGFGQKKMCVYADNTTTAVALGNSELNLIVIRFAEVLLTYAEALNEAGSIPNTEVYWALNKIRKRATVNMPDITPGLTKEKMRDVIRLERRIELAGEGLYYMDIKRWKTAEIVNNGPILNYQGTTIEVRSFNKIRDYLWAIPSVEIQENKNLQQNPGW